MFVNVPELRLTVPLFEPEQTVAPEESMPDEAASTVSNDEPVGVRLLVAIARYQRLALTLLRMSVAEAELEISVHATLSDEYCHLEIVGAVNPLADNVTLLPVQIVGAGAIETVPV